MIGIFSCVSETIPAELVAAYYASHVIAPLVFFDFKLANRAEFYSTFVMRPTL
jgi:hypothetical protein